MFVLGPGALIGVRAAAVRLTEPSRS